MPVTTPPPKRSRSSTRPPPNRTAGSTRSTAKPRASRTGIPSTSPSTTPSPPAVSPVPGRCSAPSSGASRPPSTRTGSSASSPPPMRTASSPRGSSSPTNAGGHGKPPGAPATHLRRRRRRPVRCRQDRPRCPARPRDRRATPLEKQLTTATTGRVAGITSAAGVYAVVDVLNMGAGVVDQLREQGHQVVAFNASEHSDLKDRSGELGFVNKRSAAWWNLRDMLGPDSGENLALPPDDLLTGDLTTPHWRVVSGGRSKSRARHDHSAPRSFTRRRRCGHAKRSGRPGRSRSTSPRTAAPTVTGDLLKANF